MCVVSRLGEGAPSATIQRFGAIASSKTRRPASDCFLGSALRRIVGAMSEAADLARRFLTLWEDYLTALARRSGRRRSCCDAGSPRPVGPRARPAAGERTATPGPPAGAASAAGASGERDDAVAELARRLAHLEERVAALERGRTSGCAASPPKSTRSAPIRSRAALDARDRAPRRIATSPDSKPIVATPSAAVTSCRRCCGARARRGCSTTAATAAARRFWSCRR